MRLSRFALILLALGGGIWFILKIIPLFKHWWAI